MRASGPPIGTARGVVALRGVLGCRFLCHRKVDVTCVFDMGVVADGLESCDGCEWTPGSYRGVRSNVAGGGGDRVGGVWRQMWAQEQGLGRPEV